MRYFSRSVALLFGLWLAAVPFSAAQAAILITIDKARQQMTVEVDGATRWVWPVSTGRRGYDTPSGDFRAFRMEEDHYSKEWDDAPMPYSIFFTSEGHAIHGSYETRNLGRRASHGCVRISPSNASRLFTLVKREGVSNARVVVLPDHNEPIVAKRNAPARVQQAQKPVVRPPATATLPGEMDASRSVFSAPEQSYGYVPSQPYGYVPSRRMLTAPDEQPSAGLPAVPAGQPMQIVPNMN
jgi:hypothetical protein